MFEQTISVDRLEQAVSLFGSFDENIRLIEREYGVSVISRGSDLKVTGEAGKRFKSRACYWRALNAH